MRKNLGNEQFLAFLNLKNGKKKKLGKNFKYQTLSEQEKMSVSKFTQFYLNYFLHLI